MTADFSLNTKLTFITATYLQATGWYRFTSGYIRESNWGLRKGCEFLTVVSPFCPNVAEYGSIDVPSCSSDYTYKGKFESTTVANAMEECPILNPANIISAAAETESNFCTSNLRTMAFNNDTNSFQERFGANSRCFLGQYSHKNVDSFETTIKIPLCHNAACELDVNG
jgi:hypothetical protein